MTRARVEIYYDNSIIYFKQPAAVDYSINSEFPALHFIPVMPQAFTHTRLVTVGVNTQRPSSNYLQARKIRNSRAPLATSAPLRFLLTPSPSSNTCLSCKSATSPPPQLTRTDEHRIDQPTIVVVRARRAQYEIDRNVLRARPLGAHYEPRGEVPLQAIRAEVGPVDGHGGVLKQREVVLAHAQERLVLRGREPGRVDLLGYFGLRTGVPEQDLHSVVGAGIVVVAKRSQDCFFFSFASAAVVLVVRSRWLSQAARSNMI